MDVSHVNSVRGPWQPLMKETKFAPSMMVALVGECPHPAEQHREDHSTHGDGLCPCDLRAAGDAADSGTASAGHGATANGVDPM